MKKGFLFSFMESWKILEEVISAGCTELETRCSAEAVSELESDLGSRELYRLKYEGDEKVLEVSYLPGESSSEQDIYFASINFNGDIEKGTEIDRLLREGVEQVSDGVHKRGNGTSIYSFRITEDRF